MASSQVARDRLAACSQRGRSVNEYVNDFGNCLLRLPGVSDSERLDRFVQGLSSKIQIQVLLKQPSSYHDALAVDTGYRQSVHASAFASEDVAPIDLGTAEAPHRQAGAQKKGKGRKKQPQRAAPKNVHALHKTGRAANDTCHNCGRRGHWAAQCTQELRAAELEIGTSAIEASDLMRIPVFIIGHQAQAVVDTGATATFVSDLYHRLRFPFTTSGPNCPRIRLADGRSTPISGKTTFLLAVPDITNEHASAWVRTGHHSLILGLDWLPQPGMKIQVGGHVLRRNPAKVDAEGEITKNQELDTLECADASRHMTNEQHSDGTLAVEHDVLHMPTRADCDACQAAKLKTLRAPRKKETTRFAGFNETVSVELVDPTEVGICGTRWLFTHREAATGWPPRLVKSDEGGEFQGTFETALKTNLVAHEIGLAHRPSTHATHERVHRDLNSKICALLLAAGFEPEWFAFATQYWAVARNAIWKGALGTTRNEALYGFPWNRDISPFGREIHVMAPDRSKFDSPGTLALAMGLRVPSPTTIGSRLNILAIPFADLCFSAARWVGEWRLSTQVSPCNTSYPRRRTVARVMPERNAAIDPRIDPSLGARAMQHDVGEDQAVQEHGVPAPAVAQPGAKRERRVWSAEMNDALRDMRRTVPIGLSLMRMVVTCFVGSEARSFDLMRQPLGCSASAPCGSKSIGATERQATHACWKRCWVWRSWRSQSIRMVPPTKMQQAAALVPISAWPRLWHSPRTRSRKPEDSRLRKKCRR
ncbi:hypothetical protein FVE85_4384 [Porphyridium purpureum]|uniref:CCHC-type domain-containing protein n=1 Tax=Porphyridium purpureum TaxID=35688 RepID=A0A5J4YJA8_PORPP|nr:hypothetical protein FVE85_4384 [Porphyridium purpureum]|eukprot:POR3015..scf270_19